MAPQSDSDDEAAFLDSAQDARAQVENLHLHVHGFSAPKLDWHLPKLGRMCCNPEKIARKNALALPRSLCLHALTLPDRILGLFC